MDAGRWNVEVRCDLVDHVQERFVLIRVSARPCADVLAESPERNEELIGEAIAAQFACAIVMLATAMRCAVENDVPERVCNRMPLMRDR